MNSYTRLWKFHKNVFGQNPTEPNFYPSLNFLQAHCEMGLHFSRLWERLFLKKEMRILMVGLDAAGKTTIL